MIVGVAREVGHDPQDRGFADPTIAVQDHMKLLVFDKMDQTLEQFSPSSETARVRYRMRRRESFAQACKIDGCPCRPRSPPSRAAELR